MKIWLNAATLTYHLLNNLVVELLISGSRLWELLRLIVLSGFLNSWKARIKRRRCIDLDFLSDIPAILFQVPILLLIVILLADLVQHSHAFHRQPNIDRRVLLVFMLSMCLIFAKFGLALPEQL